MGVYIHETIYAKTYTCKSFQTQCVRKKTFLNSELMFIAKRLASLNVCAHMMFEILTVQIFILNNKIIYGPQ